MYFIVPEHKHAEIKGSSYEQSYIRQIQHPSVNFLASSSVIK